MNDLVTRLRAAHGTDLRNAIAEWRDSQPLFFEAAEEIERLRGNFSHRAVWWLGAIAYGLGLFVGWLVFGGHA